MKKKVAKQQTPLSLKFITKDGILVMDRKIEDWVFAVGEFDEVGFLDIVIAADARRKGVKVLRTDVHRDGAISTVEWLSSKA